ncbi:winged helix-turn-helix domain-containing protein [Deinococcus pimensis]|uniref:winged helix-turn-helix domain-containing protein n=1 Tax=Deinococcus pimensis TaxID=309888 RepID=UPI000A02CA98|nr:winged helix-turn-helix domain-containing protein [Deinococcus pimensis]
MTWRPSHFTRAQMEERRLEAARLFQQHHLTHPALARELGVHLTTIQRSHRTFQAGGPDALRARTAPGRTPYLTADQKRDLLTLLTQGGPHHGYPTDEWTLPRVRNLLWQHFKVLYPVGYFGTLLHTLGWSPQKPVKRARERDDGLVEHWHSETLSELKKRTSRVTRPWSFSRRQAELCHFPSRS